MLPSFYFIFFFVNSADANGQFFPTLKQWHTLFTPLSVIFIHTYRHNDPLHFVRNSKPNWGRKRMKQIAIPWRIYAANDLIDFVIPFIIFAIVSMALPTRSVGRSLIRSFVYSALGGQIFWFEKAFKHFCMWVWVWVWACVCGVHLYYLYIISVAFIRSLFQ